MVAAAVIVVDASALTNELTDDGPVGVRCRALLAEDPHWVAPEHLVVEVFAAVRARWLGGHLDDGRARDVLAALSEAALDLVATAALLPRMRELRDNLTGYDAASVAVAEAVGAPLRHLRCPSRACSRVVVRGPTGSPRHLTGAQNRAGDDSRTRPGHLGRDPSLHLSGPLGRFVADRPVRSPASVDLRARQRPRSRTEAEPMGPDTSRKHP